MGWLLAATGMLSVSTDSLWIRVSEADAVNMAFLVAACALPLHAVLSRWLDHASPVESLRRKTRPLLVVAALAAVSQLAFIAAITETRVANAVAIVAASPLAAAVFARLALGERITRRVMAAIAITVAGIGLIVATSVGQPTLRGDLLALLAVLAFAAGMVVWRRHADMSRFAGLSVSAAIVLVATGAAASPLSLDARAYLAAAAMGLCFNPLGRLAHTNAPRFAPVAEVALFTPVETVAGMVWATLFLGEPPRLSAAAGGVVVIAGVAYGTFGAMRSGVSATPAASSQ